VWYVYDFKKRWLVLVDLADVSMQPSCNGYIPDERATPSKYHQIDLRSSPLNTIATALKCKGSNSGDTELSVE